MTGKQLLELLETESSVTCITNANVCEECIFGEVGFIVVVSKARVHEDTVEIRLDGTKYIESNHKNATPNWYDRSGNPVLKYFESAPGKEIDSYHIDDSSDYDCGVDLYCPSEFRKQYTESASDLSYIEWLEQRLREALATLEKTSS